MPDPKVALARYEAALERRDTEALSSMLTERARASWSREQLGEILERDREQLLARARAVSDPAAQLDGRAELAYENGVFVSLSLEEGEFLVDGAAALPLRPTSPKQALAAFARALAIHDVSLLAALLTPSTQKILESSLEGLKESLANHEEAIIETRGDRATAEFMSGHRVVLRQRKGVWLVEEIE